MAQFAARLPKPEFAANALPRAGIARAPASGSDTLALQKKFELMSLAQRAKWIKSLYRKNEWMQAEANHLVSGYWAQKRRLASATDPVHATIVVLKIDQNEKTKLMTRLHRFEDLCAQLDTITPAIASN